MHAVKLKFSMSSRIINWIKSQVVQAKAKGIVMGLSGGIDSCVVAALAKKEVGRNRLLALILPCGSHVSDLADATAMARKFKIKTEIIDLSGVYNNLLKILPPSKGLAKNNLKPRLRMLILYYFANKLNYLVCGTGNKSELMVGYFTKHGDGGVDILPIGGLLKKQVRALAEELGIPGNIINKPPSAGLWHGQTDEGEMGITYNELDDILERMANDRKQLSAKGAVAKVKKMVNNSGHKRSGPKVCDI